MLRLENTLRDYAWGNESGIPEILGREPDGRPAAELWLGAHPGAPSTTDAGSLADVIARSPRQALGERSVEAFGERLPFLLKILSAKQALSIQAHPSLSQAAAGFAKEEAAGIVPEAPHRNYKDASHKPELIYALTRFEALSGLRAAAETAATLRQIRHPSPLWEQLLSAVDDNGGSQASDQSHALARGIELILSHREEFGRIAADIAGTEGAVSSGARHGEFAALDTIRLLSADYPGDAGIIVALFLNRVVLEPGEAMALGARELHAYLSGLGVEIMASSDNVLRGGLTGKHIDVAELLDVVSFEAAEPAVVEGAIEQGGRTYRCAAREFALHVIEEAPSGAELPRNGAAIALCVAGEFILEGAGETLALGQGESVFLAADESAVAARGTGKLFLATTALEK